MNQDNKREEIKRIDCACLSVEQYVREALNRAHEYRLISPQFMAVRERLYDLRERLIKAVIMQEEEMIKSERVSS